MDVLQRLILGMAIAVAHWAAWPAAYAPAEATIPCACAAAGDSCVCTECACTAAPERQDAPAPPDERVPSTETQRGIVGAPAEITAIPDDKAAPSLGVVRTARSPSNWLGTAPFASWCVWRT